MTNHELNTMFGIPGCVEFVDYHSFQAIKVSTFAANAIISLYGAHLISYQPAGQEEVFWMSDTSLFEQGKPMRGGIPICFPWFGPHPSDASKPLHGFARIMDWNVVSVKMLPEDHTEILLSFSDNTITRNWWPYAFQLTLCIEIGAELKMNLKIHNTSKESMICSQAFHSYFAIGNLNALRIQGTEATKYYNALKNREVETQAESSLAINQETNRIYFNHTGVSVIVDEALKRKIAMTKSNSSTTVIWNPWIETAKKMADMPDEAYKHFVCVEAVNAFNDAATIEAGQSHTLGMKIRLGSL